MADQSTTDLKYGHFGQIIYSQDDHTWLLPRKLESSSTLEPLGTSQLVFKPQPSQSRPDPIPTGKPSVHLNRQIADLLHFDPTIAPSAHLLVEPALVSQEIQKIITRHDPTTGHLLAFGRVPDHATKRSMTIVTFPAADHAHILRLVQVQPQKHGWERNKSVWIDVPRISGESGTWHAPQPIRQICFADADEDSNLARTLAVRTTTAVHIIRVAARKRASSWNSLTGTPSRFHTDQLCNLNLDLFSGLAPAHVAFNHWYSKQFITVDQYGTWHVWDSSLRQIPSEHGKTIELCRGATNDQAVPDEETTTTLLDDGWGRALWAGNVQTIITASRRCLGIYDIQAKPVRLQSPDLGIAGTPHWILDIMLNPLDPTLVFVLTSISLFCLRVQCLDEFDPESYSTAGAEIVMQCRHFRDPEDTGLGLSNFVDDIDVIVFIKSSLSPLATSFRFTPNESTPRFLKVADATKLVLPEIPTTTSSAALTFQIQPAKYGESVHHEQPSGPGKIYRDLSTRFFVGTAIASDMTVVQKLYYATPSTVLKSSSPEVAPPDWRGRLVQSHPRLQETGFVAQSLVNQGLGNTQEDQDVIVSSHADPRKSTRDDWTMLYELSHARATGAASKTEDFSRILSRIETALQAPEPTYDGPKLLSEVFDDQILVPDIDQAAAEFKDLVSAKTEHGEDMEDVDQRLQLARIGYSSLNLGSDSNMDLMAIYDNIVAHWLTPLSQTVPGRVRLVKEQLARRIAAGLCLASHVLRQPPVEPNEETIPETQATEEAYSFPQSSLPTPSPTATPSMTTVTSLSSHPSTLVSPEFARLQRYTTFAPDKPTPSPLPKGLTNTLAHWSLGRNPEKYDWLAVQREQEKKAEEEDEDLTPRERARLKRRAEKLLDKQRREAQKASAMSLANSQVPGIVSASQPAFMTPSRSEAPNVPHSARAASQGTQLLASSQAAPNMFTSQIQPGKFGGKPAKKKRRVVGF